MTFTWPAAQDNKINVTLLIMAAGMWRTRGERTRANYHQPSQKGVATWDFFKRFGQFSEYPATHLHVIG